MHRSHEKFSRRLINGGYLSSRGEPVALKDGVEQAVPPAPLHPFGFAQATFAFHANAGHNAGGSDIVGDTIGVNAMQVEIAETESQQSTGGFSSITLAPRRGVQLV